MDQKFKLWVRIVSAKIWAFQNALNSICAAMRTTCGQNFSSIRRCLLELLSQNPPKCAQLGPEPKKMLFLLCKVKNGKYPEAETWHPESIYGWSYFRLCENFWWPFGSSLDPIWAQKMFRFCLILQEFCNFSGTWDLRYLAFLRIFCRNFVF